MVTEMTGKCRLVSKTRPFHLAHAAGDVTASGGEEKKAMDGWERVSLRVFNHKSGSAGSQATAWWVNAGGEKTTAPRTARAKLLGNRIKPAPA